MPIAIIVAYDEQGGIGLDGKMPWHFREDLQYFKAQTLGKTLLMGYETYQGLPIRPLPQRTTVVATRTKTIAEAEVEATRDVQAYLQAYATSEEWLFVAGGSVMYAYALPLAKRLYITKIPGVYPVDTWFPKWDQTAFTQVHVTQGEAVRFEVYERKE